MGKHALQQNALSSEKYMYFMATDIFSLSNIFKRMFDAF